MLIGFVCTSPVVFSSDVLKYSWRFPFIFGALVGLAGAVARSTIKEANDFADRKKALSDTQNASKPSKKVSWTTILAYFTMLCGDPACMYFAYFYCGNLLRNNFGLSPNQVLLNNCVVGFSDLLSLIFITYLSYRVFPLKIIKAKCVALCAISFAFPVLLELWPNRFTVLTIQCLIAILNFAPTPAWPILYKHFPVLQRFRYTGFIIALARLAIYGISPFAMGSAIKNFGYKGIPLFFMLFGVCVYFAITFFERKEKTTLKEV
jgi:MFS transporter, MHS family, proline/betaine transporter